MRIIQSLSMVEKVTVKRTLKQRIFGRPWNPLRSHDTKMTPMGDAIQLTNGDLVMHPETYRRYCELEQEERIKSAAETNRIDCGYDLEFKIPVPQFRGEP